MHELYARTGLKTHPDFPSLSVSGCVFAFQTSKIGERGLSFLGSEGIKGDAINVRSRESVHSAIMMKINHLLVL